MIKLYEDKEKEEKKERQMKIPPAALGSLRFTQSDLTSTCNLRCGGSHSTYRPTSTKTINN
jgi:hypothetical protein